LEAGKDLGRPKQPAALPTRQHALERQAGSDLREANGSTGGAMKMFICPECGQINGHHLFCPEMPEPLDMVEDEALDELEEAQKARSNKWPESRFPQFIEQDADE
jgi:hypothetical protein